MQGLEFRWSDDAWYDVILALSDWTLTVSFTNFSSSDDEKYHAHDFKSLKEVQSFRQRFRPVSLPLQDSECQTVTPGTLVCASTSVNGDDVKFYDAFVDEVKNNEHSFLNGEEECLCKFLLWWQHGPHAGHLTSADIGKVCLIQSNEILDPSFAAFLKISIDKIEGSLVDSGAMSRVGILVEKDNLRSETCGLSLKHEARPEASYIWEEKYKLSNRLLQAIEGGISNDPIEQEKDMGSQNSTMEKLKGCYYYIVLIDNLEKDLSPSTMVQFLYRETGVFAQSYVFPCLPLESYTRGIFLVDCKDKIEKLHDFLVNQDHMIVSSGGRPWVISAKFLELCTRTSIGIIIPDCSEYQIVTAQSHDQLKLVSSGTQEYETAKQLRDLFNEFADHQKLMHKELALQESAILQGV